MIESFADTDPVPEKTPRPLWSVMIPTCDPREDQLAQALASVLGQFAQRDQLGRGSEVQIEIVDDASVDFDPGRFLTERRLDGVSVYRHSRRLGMAGNWNSCIERSRGRFIHLLHQDDFVFPGFYEAMRRGLESPGRREAGAAFCASSFLEADGRVVSRGAIPGSRAGILVDWQEHIFTRLEIQTASIVVRREVYERLGRFDADFVYAADWDMWKRIAADYPIWYDPRALACFRRHPDSQTARLRRSGETIADLSKSIARSESLLPVELRAKLSARARRAYTLFAVEEAVALMRRAGNLRATGSMRAAFANLREGRRLGSSADFAFALATVFRRALGYAYRRDCLRVAPSSD